MTGKFSNILMGAVISAFALFLASSAGAQWRGWSETDEMSGEEVFYTNSPSVKATKDMSFPYHDVVSWLGTGCNSKGEQWAYIGFSEEPNLNTADIQSGYNLVRTRIKWDDEITHTTLSQEWGGKFLRWTDDARVIDKMKVGNTVLLELNWHSNGRIYFRYSLAGATEAMAPCQEYMAKAEAKAEARATERANKAQREMVKTCLAEEMPASIHSCWQACEDTDDKAGAFCADIAAARKKGIAHNGEYNRVKECENSAAPGQLLFCQTYCQEGKVNQETCSKITN